MNELENKLDLTPFLNSFRKFLSREENFKVSGDLNHNLKIVRNLEKRDFSAPDKIEPIFHSIQKLGKFGTLSLAEIFEILKITRYFKYLQGCEFPNEAGGWFEKISIPDYFLEISKFFDKKGKFLDIDERLVSISIGIKEVKEEIKTSLYKTLNSRKMEEFLVDKQIHLFDEIETLLLRGGFQKVLKGSILGRTSSGFFYVSPDSISNLEKRVRNYQQEREEIILSYRKEISKRLKKFIPFIKFIDREFNKFDALQSRLFFAKSQNLQFLIPEKSSKIEIKDFKHPAIENPIPLNLDFSKSLLMITGVNAGGKTVLLKSILSIAYLSKNMMPMKIDSFNSTFGRFQNIFAIIDDPQNVNFDISTFAGRMVQFSEILNRKNSLIGIDEVELGTDADEASALFKILIEKLMENGSKIIVTTHHKRLASLMGKDKRVELLASLFDEKERKPTYRFLKGIVGKSYAFETAERYGIPKNLVEKAKKVYGEDSEKLNELIEKGANLERELLEKNRIAQEKIDKLEADIKKFEDAKESFFEKLKEKKGELHQTYQGAISEAKKAISAKTVPETHRHLTEAHKKLPKNPLPDSEKKFDFKVGEKVRYNSFEGIILKIRQKKALVEMNGMRVEIELSKLKKGLKNLPKKREESFKVKIEKPSKGDIILDLHGMRREEALEELDIFISNALLHGFDEVFITHGIGSGILAKAVKEFLKTHPRVIWFGDAPPNMGGQGAKLVRL